MHATPNVQTVEKKFLRSDLPEFRSGDTIKVHAKITEGNKERIQYVEGVVIRKSGSGSTKTFTLRKISGGIGVEIIYPLTSKNVANIEVISRGDVRRSRLYYIRGLSGKAARLKSKDSFGSSSEGKSGVPVDA
ncbi:MAG: 50S ribosomal protein L19 [Oligoflexia bacterium]|nr:50S ribosomal protein L19 [Oligoflexia bacterium]